jgi:hypothetical protein
MHSTTFLRKVLLVDAITSAAMGLMLVFGAEFLANMLGLPQPLLLYSGMSLFPFAAFVAWVATRSTLWRAGVWAVIACNVLWAIDSVLLLVPGWVAPAMFGTAFVIAQAVFVVVLAELEYVGLRRASA